MISRRGPKKRYCAVSGESDAIMSLHSGSSSGRIARIVTISPSSGISQWYLLGVHGDHQVRPGQGDLAHLLGVDDDARVEGEDAVCAHEQRVDVHLDDLGEVDEQVADLDQRLLERDHVDGLRPAVAVEELADLRAVDHGAGQRLIERREVDRHVAVELDARAAHAEDERRAEGRVLLGADDDLVATAAHGLHDDARDLGLGPQLAHALRDLRELGCRVRRRGDVQRDAGDVDLVADVGAQDLHGHGKTDLLGGRGALLRAGRHERAHDGDLVGLDDPSALPAR